MPDRTSELEANASDPSLTAFRDPATGVISFYKNTADPAKLQKQGLVPATPEEVERRGSFLKNTTLGGQAGAAAKLATRVLTFGTANGDAQSTQQIKDFSTVSPTLATTAKLAGALAPALATGGTVGGVAGALGLAGRGAAIATTVAEEVAGNTAFEVERAKEENDQISLGNILLGVGLGSGLQLVGRAAKGLLPGKFAGRAGEALGDEASPLAKGLRQSEERRSVGAMAAEEAPRRPATAQEVESYAANPEQHHAEVNQIGHDALADAYTGHEGVTGQSGGAMRQVHSVAWKEQDVIPHMVDVDAGTVFDSVAEHVEKAHAVADVLDSTGQKLAARRIRQAASEVSTDVLQADEGTLAAKAAVGMDRLKREGDDILSNYLRNKSVTAKSAAKEISKWIEPLRENLQDKNTWGDFWAEKQTRENALWSGDNGIIQLSNIWQPEVLTAVKGKARVQTGDALAEVANRTPVPDLAEKFLAMPRIKAEKTLGAWESTLDQVERMTDMKREAGLLRPAGEMGEDPVATLQRSIEQQRQTIEELRHLRDVAPRAKPLLKKAEASGTAQAIGEMVLHHIPGGKAADKLTGAVTGKSLSERLFKPEPLPPQAPVTRASALQSIASKQRARSGGFGDLAAMAGAAGLGVAGLGLAVVAKHPTTQALARISANARALQERAALGLMSPDSRPPPLEDPTTRMQGDWPTPEAAFGHIVQSMVSAADDPLAFAQGMSHAYGEIGDGGHGELFTQMAVRTQLGVQYLLKNMPPSVGVSLSRPNGAAPDALGLAKFASMYGAVFSPGDVVYDVASGEATPTQVKTLQAVHPDIYQDLLNQTMQQIGAAEGDVPFETLRTLDCLFNLGPALGRSFSPQFSNILAQQRAQRSNPSSGKLGGTNAIAPPSATTKLGGLAAIQ